MAATLTLRKHSLPRKTSYIYYATPTYKQSLDAELKSAETLVPAFSFVMDFHFKLEIFYLKPLGTRV